MPWIRLESSGGLRITAPSFNPPPQLEGIDKMLGPPMHVRSFHCFRVRRGGNDSSVETNNDEDDAAFDDECDLTEELRVLVQRRTVGGKLGDVCIVVGSSSSSEAELTTLMDCVFDAIQSTNNAGARLLLDALCAAFPPPVTSSFSTEADPHYPSANRQEMEREGNGYWNNKDGNLAAYFGSPPDPYKAFNMAKRAANMPIYASLIRRRALLYFTTQDVVPVSLLHCRLPSVRPDSCTASLTGAPQKRKSLFSLAASATRAVRCLITVVHRTLSEAFGTVSTADRFFFPSAADPPALFAAFSTSGLLCASPLFYRLTNHRERLFISAAAIDQLCGWPFFSRDGGNVSSLIYTRELLLRCGGVEGPVMRLVVLSVGSAVACVFGFHAASESATQWDAVALNRFLNEQLATPRLVLSMPTTFAHATDNGEEEEEEEEKDEENVHEVHNGEVHVESDLKEEFAPHVLLCASVLRPTPWFSRFLRDVEQLDETTRDDFIEKPVQTNNEGNPNSAKRTTTSGSSKCIPVVLRFCSHKGKQKRAAARRFVWYTDASGLPLDVAWCVACSHIVKTEAAALAKSHDTGHLALFTTLTSCKSKTVGGGSDLSRSGSANHATKSRAEVRRYGIAWFQHNWREESFHACSVMDPTRLLWHLTPIGGGPRAVPPLEPTGGKWYTCMRLSKAEKASEDANEGPLLRTQMNLFPREALLIVNESNPNETPIDETSEEGEGVVHWQTAFYAIALQGVGGSDAVRQEVLLLDGDQTEREEEVFAALRESRGGRASHGLEDLIACNEAATRVLEGAWTAGEK